MTLTEVRAKILASLEELKSEQPDKFRTVENFAGQLSKDRVGSFISKMPAVLLNYSDSIYTVRGRQCYSRSPKYQAVVFVDIDRTLTKKIATIEELIDYVTRKLISDFNVELTSVKQVLLEDEFIAYSIEFDYTIAEAFGVNQ